MDNDTSKEQEQPQLRRSSRIRRRVETSPDSSEQTVEQQEPKRQKQGHGPAPSGQLDDATAGPSLQGQIQVETPAEELKFLEGLDLSLQIRWTSVIGRTKVTQLALQPMKTCHECKGLHKRLVARVFSETQRPHSLTSPEYYQFNTQEECLNYPLDVANTSFRLVACHEGWQYVVHESPQQMTAARSPAGPDRDFIHVVSIEFETVARVIGALGIRLSMVAYPIVAINKAKLMDVVHRMQTDPEFKGIL